MRVGNKETKPRVTRKYKTADELQAAIDAYFANPHEKTILYKGEEIRVQKVTVEYIAIHHLGFKSKQSLYDYRNRYPQEGYDEVINNLIDQVTDYWKSQGENGNATFAALMVSTLGRDKERIKFDKESTALQKARLLLEKAGKSEISLDTMQKLMAGVKAESDINKVDELERLVRELADMAGIK